MLVLPLLQHPHVVDVHLNDVRRRARAALPLNGRIMSEVDAADQTGEQEPERRGAHGDPAPGPIHEASLRRMRRHGPVWTSRERPGRDGRNGVDLGGGARRIPWRTPAPMRNGDMPK
jgi:hypothetical protein